MSLQKYQNITSLKKAREQGFTIVELLIVIIVIAILAALVISAYTGIQGEANTSANRSDAKSFATALSANLPDSGTYPANAAAATTLVQSGTRVSSNITAIAAPTGNGQAVNVGYAKCTGNGAVIKWWDSKTGAPSTLSESIKLGATAGCT